MADRKVLAWMVALGTVVGALSGVVAVITFIRDYDNPVARAILDDAGMDRANRREIEASYNRFRTRDEAAWQAAVAANTVQSYTAYVTTFPAGRYISDAIGRRDRLLELLAWTSALQQDTPEAYDIYLATFPDGSHASAARTNRGRAQGLAASGGFSLQAVDADARSTVQRARMLAGWATEAQRRARAGVGGYASDIRRGAQWMPGVTFEGKVSTYKTILGFEGITPIIGVWTASEEAVGFPAGVVTIRGQLLSHSAWSGSRFRGEMMRRDGTIYQGEFGTILAWTPHGWGALWSAKGELIGSGLWKDGALSESR